MQYSENYEMKKPEASDFYDVGDFNDNTDFLDAKIRELEDARDALDAAVKELKKSAGDGKRAVASAITGMGVDTEPDAAFATMAANIRALGITMSEDGGRVTASINGNNPEVLTVAHGQFAVPKMTWTGEKLAVETKMQQPGYMDGVDSVIIYQYSGIKREVLLKLF